MVCEGVVPVGLDWNITAELDSDLSNKARKTNTFNWEIEQSWYYLERLCVVPRSFCVYSLRNERRATHTHVSSRRAEISRKPLESTTSSVLMSQYVNLGRMSPHPRIATPRVSRIVRVHETGGSS